MAVQRCLFCILLKRSPCQNDIPGLVRTSFLLVLQTGCRHEQRTRASTCLSSTHRKASLQKSVSFGVPQSAHAQAREFKLRRDLQTHPDGAANAIWTKTRTACHNSSLNTGACIACASCDSKTRRPARVMGSKASCSSSHLAGYALGNSTPTPQRRRRPWRRPAPPASAERAAAVADVRVRVRKRAGHAGVAEPAGRCRNARVRRA